MAFDSEVARLAPEKIPADGVFVALCSLPDGDHATMNCELTGSMPAAAQAIGHMFKNWAGAARDRGGSADRAIAPVLAAVADALILATTAIAKGETVDVIWTGGAADEAEVPHARPH